MFCRFLSCLLVTLSLSAQTDAGLRVFTDTQGRTIKARLISVAADQVTVQREDGQQFTMAVSKLSAADQTFIKQQASMKTPAAAVGAVTAAQLNEAVGREMFMDTALWERPAEQVAQQLELRPESKTKTQSSFRSYPDEAYRLFGARPFSAALYAENEKPTALSLVFANKGDLFGAKGSGELHFEKDEVPKEAKEMLEKAMQADVVAITTALSKVLGEPIKMRFGEGAARETVDRWDWGPHAILLKEKELEYVGLEVVTKAFADAGGTVNKTAETIVRERVKSNLESRENGDVVIGDLPMVDQGPKGYCAPATMERAMRHLGLSADMYVLAMTGNTSFGGGTSMYALFDGIGQYIRRKGRSFDNWTGEMKIKELAKYIDRGVPVIWGLSSTQAFNDIANQRTKTRAGVTNWTEWKAQMEQAAAESALLPDRESSHVVLIIGYNKETDEIAFSDSWGERYKERWITVGEAEKVSQQRFYVISF
jgi:hypothetical protein